MPFFGGAKAGSGISVLDSGNTTIEVPIIFPSHCSTRRRYLLSSESRTLERVRVQPSLGGDDNSTESSAGAALASDDDAFLGSASVSTFVMNVMGGSSLKNDAVLTTCALVEKPSVLVVSLSCGAFQKESPMVIEVDLSNTKQTQPKVVKVKAFYKDGYIQLFIMDSHGEIIALKFIADTLTPVPKGGVQVVGVTDLFSKNMKEESMGSLSGFQLFSSMIEFLSPNIVVLAYSPFLITVQFKNIWEYSDYTNDVTLHVWSETQCLQEMESRQSYNIGTIFNKASDILLGKLEVGFVDMAPTAALCCVQEQKHNQDRTSEPTFVFTLHSDATIRRWTIQDHHHPYPYEVVTLVSPDHQRGINTINQLPNPTSWTGTPNSIDLCAKLFEGIYALAVYIQTESSSSSLSTQQRQQQHQPTNITTNNNNCHRLFVIHGGIDTNSQSALMSAQALSIPQNIQVQSFIGMAFFNVYRCSLSIMLQTATMKNDDHNNASGSNTFNGITQLTYPPSTTSIITPEPELTSAPFYLDHVADSERTRIESLAFAKDIIADYQQTPKAIQQQQRRNNNESKKPNSTLLDDQLHELDSRYLKYLFRPAYPRGNGTVLPPSTMVIRKAIQKIIYTGSSAFGYLGGSDDFTNVNNDDNSIELKTIRAMHQWRQNDERKIISMTPVLRRGRRGGPRTPATGGRRGGLFTPSRTKTSTPGGLDTPAAGSLVVNANTPGSFLSVYDSYVATVHDLTDDETEKMNNYNTYQIKDPANDDDDDDDEMDYMDDSEKEQQRSAQLESHEHRWKRFLLLVWEEEQILRMPLCFRMVDYYEGAPLLIRAGFTSVITNAASSHANKSPFLYPVDYTPYQQCLEEADNAALKLLNYMEKDKKYSSKLHYFEQDIFWNIIAKINNAVLDERQDLPSVLYQRHNISNLVHDAIRDGNILSGRGESKLKNHLVRLLVKMNAQNVFVKWLHETPYQSSLPVLGFLLHGNNDGNEIKDDDRNDDRNPSPMLWKNKIADSHIRQATCALSVRCLDSARRLLLGRYLLVSHILEMSTSDSYQVVGSTLFYAYLRSIAVLWTSSQHVAMPLTAFDTTLRKDNLRLGGVGGISTINTGENDEFEQSPPHKRLSSKRLSFGAGATSILSCREIHGKTTSLDSLLIYVLQTRTSNISNGGSDSISLVGSIAKELYSSLLRSPFSATHDDVQSGILYRLLPELQALPPSSFLDGDSTIAKENPRLGLRLLLPLVLFNSPAPPLAEEAADVATSRKECFAECLLIESHTISCEETKSQMMEQACRFLDFNNSDAKMDMDYHEVDSKTVQVSYERLLRTANVAAPNTSPVWSSITLDLLAQKVQTVICGDENNYNKNNYYDEPALTISSDIRRLCGLETVRFLSYPLIHQQQQESTYEEIARDLKVLSPFLLHLSNLMRRLDILEHHVVGSTSQSLKSQGDGSGDNSGNSPTAGLLLNFIEQAIDELSSLDTKWDVVCRDMPEYISLYSRLFHNAVLARHWDKAYDACVANPSGDRKVSNFKRLVRSMVDAGALEELLIKCSALATPESTANPMMDAEESGNSTMTLSANECVDLYTIAAETLLETCSRGDLYYMIRANEEGSSGGNGQIISDFQGALYSLHASQGEWKRATQALDLRFINAMTALMKKPQQPPSSLLTAKYDNDKSDLAVTMLREGIIVEDLVLASVGVANTIHLIDDDDGEGGCRFIVSGEHGQFPLLPTDDSERSYGSSSSSDSGYSAGGTKRRREGKGSNRYYVEDLTDKHSGVPSIVNEDRISNFMTEFDLKCRALRSIVLRTLFFDVSVEPSIAKSAFLGSGEHSNNNKNKSTIDSLFSQGYFLLGMLWAKNISKLREECTGCSAGGQDTFFNDSLSYMLGSYLIPLAIDGSMSSSTTMTRPSLLQLRRALADIAVFSSPSSLPFIVSSSQATINQPRKALESSIRATSMDFIEKITKLHTSTANPKLAVGVVNHFINYGDNGQLPEWLERLVIFGKVENENYFSSSFNGKNVLDNANGDRNDGLFARLSKVDAAANGHYRGDPSALITLYAKKGMLLEACRVVTTILLGEGHANNIDNNREDQAPSRLPEKGNIDFVPYKKIDLLWNLIDLSLSRRATTRTERALLVDARKKMEQALEKHFSLLQVSETGLPSARALNRK